MVDASASATAIPRCSGASTSIALRRAGYDDCLAIEFQEPYMTVADGLRKSVQMLTAAMPADPPPSGNWFEMYDE